MKSKKLTCIACPIGCNLIIEMKGSNIKKISGNQCPRGEGYANEEIFNPVRVLCSTVRIKNGSPAVLPVKTEQPIPKRLLKVGAAELAGILLETPVHIGAVIMKNIAGTGINVVATRDIL